MRWKAVFFLRGDRIDAQDENGRCGLKSQKSPPQIEALKPFEADMLKLFDEVEFITVSNNFQKRLRADIESIRKSDAVFIPADKTRNPYKMGREQYDKLLRENITKHYKLAPADAYSTITVKAQGIARTYLVFCWSSVTICLVFWSGKKCQSAPLREVRQEYV